MGGGRALGPVWTGAENLASTTIRSPDRPARSESLYFPQQFIYFAIRLQLKCDGTVTHGRGSQGETREWSG